MKNQNSRREFLKKAALVTGGALIGFEQIAFAKNCRMFNLMQGEPLPFCPNNPAVRINLDQCFKCGECRKFCANEITVFGQTVPQGEDPCIHCGQCTLACPEIITEQYHYQDAAKAISDPNKIVVALMAPATRVSVGEMFELAPGNVEGKIIGSLKKLGVDHVLDVTFSADLTIMEEASELLHRLEENDAKKLPMFTSCCPAWVRFIKLFYPDLLPNLSTVKSPMMMQGALVKTYYAQKMGIDPTKIVNIALMPCTAKKAEILLPGMNAAGNFHRNQQMRDVDFSLTSREIAYMINEGGIDFLQTQDAPYDSLMGLGSGAGVIFGNTGGVMEAALRTAYKVLNDKNPPADFFNFNSPVRGLDNVRQASVNLGGRTLNIAVVHGIANARPLIESIKNGTQKFDFIEVMACSGGCIGGGGQPINFEMEPTELRQLRKNVLYQYDANTELRLSCDNPQIKTIYDEFLGKPLSEKSEELLHIHYY